MNNNLSKESAGIQSYAPPVCTEIIVGTQRVICASGDNNGEMNNGGFLDE